MNNEIVAFADQLDMFASCQDIVERAAPDKFVLLKYGPNKYQRDGVVGVFEFTPEIAEQIVSDHQEKNRNLVVDFEHGTLNPNAASQGDSPAAGWIEGFEIADEGLVALVKNWSDKGRMRLENGEYRYSSPVIRFADKDKTIPCGIQSVALTNHPAIYSNDALVAANDLSNPKEKPMDKNEQMQAQMTSVKDYKDGIDDLKDGLEQSLSDLAELAKGDEEAEKKVQEFSDGLFTPEVELVATETGNGIGSLLGLSDDSSNEDVATEAKALVAIKEEAASFLKLHDKGTFDDVNIMFSEKESAMNEKNAELEKQVAMNDAEKVVEAEMSKPKCKISESMKTWAIKLAVDDRGKFDEWLTKAPVALSDSAEPADKIVALSEKDHLSSIDKETAKAFGMSDAELAAVKAPKEEDTK